MLGRLSLRVTQDLRQDLYARLHRMPIAWFDRTPTGAVITRLMDDVALVQGMASGQTLVALLDVATAIGAAVWIVSHGWRLSALLTVLAMVYVTIFRRFLPKIRTQTLEVREQLDRIFSGLKQKIDGVQIVRTHRGEAAEIAEFTNQFTELHLPRVRANRYRVAFSNLCSGVGAVGAALVFAVGAFEVTAGRLSVGELIVASSLAGLLFTPMARLSELAAVYQQASASYCRLRELFEMVDVPSNEDSAATRQPEAIEGRVEFKNVSFQYSADRPLLQDIALQIEPQTKTAIVGPTGSGKSTLMNLLLRFYEPTSGQICVDGRPLADMSTADLRRHIGVVPQEAVVFRGTLAQNIRYGTPEATDAEVAAAARSAFLEGLAAKLPQGYQTLVGEGGHPLSQGEQQRIAIARLICKNPSIIVLDEATSSLDHESEAAVQAALAQLMVRRTSFVIAHRLSTILDADRILVLDQGRIIQQGTHTDLLKQDGLYRRLFDCQFSAAPTEFVAFHEELVRSDHPPSISESILTPLSV